MRDSLLHERENFTQRPLGNAAKIIVDNIIICRVIIRILRNIIV